MHNPVTLQLQQKLLAARGKIYLFFSYFVSAKKQITNMHLHNKKIINNTTYNKNRSKMYYCNK